MGQSNSNHLSLDQITFENVSVFIEGFDPILQSVDIEIPMDQTIVLESSNPAHAVHLLSVLAGRQAPQSGRIIWNEFNLFDSEEDVLPRQKLIGSYFEHQRPQPDATILTILTQSCERKQVLKEARDHFEFTPALLQKKFRDVTYEVQKLVMLIAATLNQPQMLTLEDPAVGMNEKTFLDYLDWIQLMQRRGHLRHIFLTNNHPAALRHLESSKLFVEDGLLYLEDEENFKKAVHF
ncbi:MAG: ATP-binding cassette domain-containing protein [Bdellovibrio sp.]|nr:ATP-binding cassette domain-containing protein [Bdellovibrio sp.]